MHHSANAFDFSGHLVALVLHSALQGNKLEMLAAHFHYSGDMNGSVKHSGKDTADVHPVAKPHLETTAATSVTSLASSTSPRDKAEKSIANTRGMRQHQDHDKFKAKTMYMLVGYVMWKTIVALPWSGTVSTREGSPS